MFTPHARGSTLKPTLFRNSAMVYPACAGIDPVPSVRPPFYVCLPRMRGDRPQRDVTLLVISAFTPHARGSTRTTRHWQRTRRVYPACAGIDLKVQPVYARIERLPRMRGDRPLPPLKIGDKVWFTPHARGSTWLCGVRALPTPVYPACAGIDRRLSAYLRGCTSLPRMRGDRPLRPCWLCREGEFTPHARGSTLFQGFRKRHFPVYPACAGIDRPSRAKRSARSRLPRMRGDRPSERRVEEED